MFLTCATFFEFSARWNRAPQAVCYLSGMTTDTFNSKSPPTVLVVGAGINGAAVARELVMNGLSVVVVDANDIAFGATSRSSRLIHGGLRYLERGDVALVRESLRERSILLQVAPDFVKPLRLRIPVRRRFGGLVWNVLTFFDWDRSWLGTCWLRLFPNARERGLWLVQLGLWLYGWLARETNHAGRTIQNEELSEQANISRASPVRHSVYPWFCEYFDAQILSPERFTIALLDDARQLAREKSLRFELFTHTLAEFVDSEVRLVDRLGCNSPITLRPDIVINATGAWGDATLADWRVSSPRLFGGTKGSHFVTTNPELRGALDGCGIYAEAGDGRMVFVLPFGTDQTLVGTTDEPFDARPETAVADPNEIDYLIQLVNIVVPSARLARDDVLMSYSGVRPLPFGRRDQPGAIPRGHWIEESTRGSLPIFTLIGGKLTTCRALAEEVADRVLLRLRRPRISDSRDRPIVERRLCGEERSDSDVLDVIRHEWVRTLGDLVERRLMMVFDLQLSRTRLRQLAEMLAAEGHIPREHIDSTIIETVERLQAVYGIHVDETV